MQEINLAQAVTFVPNKHVPIHNWFYYKEGYAKDLVTWLIEKYKITGIVLDPFCGSGTTLLTCKELGMDSVGYDVSPLAVLASTVKTRTYEFQELMKTFLEFKKLELEFKGNLPQAKWLRRLFYRKTLENILAYDEWILKLENEGVRDFFRLALIASVDEVMLARKMGGSLRLEKKPIIPLKGIVQRKLKEMIKDIEKNKTKFELEPRVFQADAREQKLEGKFVHAVITSPPYLNKIEYTTVYKAELALFFKQQETKLRAFVGDELGEVSEIGQEPGVVQAYFKDMKKVLENVREGMIPGAKAFIVIAGGCLPSGAVQSDEKIGEIGKEIGFTLEEIIECRKIQCYRHNAQTGSVRESIVVLKK